MVQGCVIFFNDGPSLLEACLTSLREIGCQKIVAVDGAFSDFPEPLLQSNDGCFEVARNLADEVIVPKKLWQSQIEKRNSYLTLSKLSDLYLILDADEVIEGTLPSRIGRGEYFVDFSAPGLSLSKLVRLFSHRPGLQYRDKHSWLYDASGSIINQPDYNANLKHFPGLKITHRNNLRPQRRQEEDAQYMAKRKEPDLPQKAPTTGKESKLVSIKLKPTALQYDGFDMGVGLMISVLPGKSILVSPQKAEQLLSDFPKDWEKD